MAEEKKPETAPATDAAKAAEPAKPDPGPPPAGAAATSAEPPKAG